MSDGVTNPHGEDSFAESKGKGKAVQDEVPHDTAMDEDDDEDDDDDDDEDEVSLYAIHVHIVSVCSAK